MICQGFDEVWIFVNFWKAEFLVKTVSTIVKIFFDDLLKGIVKSPSLRNQFAKILCLVFLTTTVIFIYSYFALNIEIKEKFYNESKINALIKAFYGRIQKESAVIKEDEIRDGDKSTNLIYDCQIKKYACTIANDTNNKGLLNFELQYSHIRSVNSYENDSKIFEVGFNAKLDLMESGLPKPTYNSLMVGSINVEKPKKVNII